MLRLKQISVFLKSKGTLPLLVASVLERMLLWVTTKLAFKDGSSSGSCLLARPWMVVDSKASFLWTKGPTALEAMHACTSCLSYSAV